MGCGTSKTKKQKNTIVVKEKKETGSATTANNTEKKQNNSQKDKVDKEETYSQETGFCLILQNINYLQIAYMKNI